MIKEFTHADLIRIAIEDLPRKQAKCKHCNKIGLQWLSYQHKGLGTGWVLVEVNDGILSRHKCSEGGTVFKNIQAFKAIKD